MQFAYPTQNRYNDSYQQRVTTYGSAYNKKYLSKASNDILKMFGDNVVIKGLAVTPTFLGSTINLIFTPGLVIHDSTVVQLTASSTLTCDVAAMTDSNAGSHLAVFTDFQYLETPDADSQTALKLSVYHVNASGIPSVFSGSPAFSAARNKVMVTSLDFIKSGSNVISCSETPAVLSGDNPPYLLVSGTNYYMRGSVNSNINFWDIYQALVGSFLAEFAFHDSV